MDNKKVGSFIASLRKEKSLTQQELADELNVTNKAVSKWETGQGYSDNINSVNTFIICLSAM